MATTAQILAIFCKHRSLIKEYIFLQEDDANQGDIEVVGAQIRSPNDQSEEVYENHEDKIQETETMNKDQGVLNEEMAYDLHQNDSILEESMIQREGIDPSISESFTNVSKEVLDDHYKELLW